MKKTKVTHHNVLQSLYANNTLHVYLHCRCLCSNVMLYISIKLHCCLNYGFRDFFNQFALNLDVLPSQTTVDIETIVGVTVA